MQAPRLYNGLNTQNIASQNQSKYFKSLSLICGKPQITKSYFKELLFVISLVRLKAEIIEDCAVGSQEKISLICSKFYAEVRRICTGDESLADLQKAKTMCKAVESESEESQGSVY
ncbi:hypothetical protein NPIL_222251 [Nephila pilipes]|uniref:Uncharacterized protein n=1 Tax=Nephila pilipes TaxID=299642 RepID=A0A8X6T2H3_NEPPI|nr:hypothetical protein NPIL_222251 [Nephila pilipes]